MLQCKINFSAVNDCFAFLHCRTICGLSQATTKSHICRAALEAVCFQTREVSEHEGARIVRNVCVCVSVSVSVR